MESPCEASTQLDKKMKHTHACGSCSLWLLYHRYYVARVQDIGSGRTWLSYVGEIASAGHQLGIACRLETFRCLLLVGTLRLSGSIDSAGAVRCGTPPLRR